MHGGGEMDTICADHPRWAVRYVAQLRARLLRLSQIRSELSATRFEGAYDGADLLGYLDDECDTVRTALARVDQEVEAWASDMGESRAADAADAARDLQGDGGA
ncbi:hypothetical protein GHA01_27730 [Novacetimonas hansenii]|uniref:Uncharacterized protein n=3 Tax=Novacetimonas hansenii TaxID=436 RepID=A0ABQ0SHW8_NOVHA|nr:hypothetical protein GXY_14952 [Novacetimonas hansenii ATCC 23769]PYD73351.1 hypothetical protein CFR74_04300 [Novacetimonas hansenii]GAN85192.1 hypothetical protein Gaha_0336_005 [Novacetimonas hansenii JCM 7643]GBQ60519.1 hypothetical protein AA0243_2363 [Novacetimonas hansenii NRIC 0243]GEC64924.1 hypothetical protein GHA01_27730 [Novacetimonas hansenii]